MSDIRRQIQVGFELKVFSRAAFLRPRIRLQDVLASGDSERIHKVLVVMDESLAQARPD